MLANREIKLTKDDLYQRWRLTNFRKPPSETMEGMSFE